MHKLYIIELPSGLEYMNNFLSVYGIYNPPETRVKWGIYIYMSVTLWAPGAPPGFKMASLTVLWTPFSKL